MITRVRAKFVIGYDESDHCLIEHGELVHDDDRIVFVGRDFEGHVDTEIDAGEAIVSPGFIDTNALADIDHAIFDSWPDRSRSLGLSWSESYLSDHGPRFDRNRLKFRREFALSQLIRNGITTMVPIAAETYLDWCEDYRDMADTAEAVAALGIRAYLGPSYRTHVPYTDGSRTLLHKDERRGLNGLTDAVRFIEDFAGSASGLIQGALLPARIETQTESTLRATREAADSLQVPVRLHAAQGVFETEEIITRTGKRSIPYLHQLGFLAPKTLIPHVWTVPGNRLMPPELATAEYGASGRGTDDLSLLAETDTSVIFCPIPTAHYGGGLETFDTYRAQGVRVVIGTDSAPPNMIKALDLATAETKVLGTDRTAAQAADLFRAATLEPARALGRSDLGRLAAGTQADYFVLDLTNAHIGPYADPIRTLVMNTDGRDINRVVVAGRTIVEDGQIVTVSTSDFRERAQEFLSDYISAHTESDFAGRSLDELQPSSFPKL
ncbi:Cytosine/adenosine deaminase [Brevibacterium siliguriense]|uniref:Cytosine/adenosine deaminase n=1 Tax=Brevibacterium siliguriense TaxID=1136497 RepID=A0A1H1V679_9MICO|nr:chlorohydrolase family protein [Brevibacterium siliguriense]SDS80267.1 Cytosine/adenosine deaminase [Brevibacterium siliguriense]